MTQTQTRTRTKIAIVEDEPLFRGLLENHLRRHPRLEVVGAFADGVSALASLPERIRRLLHSLKIEERSVAETAERSGMTEGAVKVAAHRGLKTLFERFAAGGAVDDR